jgi:hypothetical protein
MALDSYVNLKASIRTQSTRTDMSDDHIDDFIAMAEAEMYSNAEAPLRFRSMESRQTASTSSSVRFLALPTGFLEMRRLKLNLSGGDCDVKYMAPDQMDLQGTSGIPRFYSVTSQLEFDRVPDSVYTIEMQLYIKLTALSTSNASNAILADHPNVYLFGSLWALWLQAQEEEKAEFYYSKFIGAIKGVIAGDKKGKYGSAPRIRLEGSTP